MSGAPNLAAFAATLAVLLLAACGSAESRPAPPVVKEAPPGAGRTPAEISSPLPTPPWVTNSVIDGGTPRPVTPAPTPSATPVPVRHGPPYTVALDPGHGGALFGGSSFRDASGTLWQEKDLALDVALRLDQLLQRAGFVTVLTRTCDCPLVPFGDSFRPSMIADLQARVDFLNSVPADIVVSLHFNGLDDRSHSGTEVYYNPDRPYGDLSLALATFLQEALVRGLREDIGYDTRDRGVKNDALVGGDPANAHSFLLGTNANFRPSLMPGAIAEPLFLSNPSDAQVLMSADNRQKLAEAYFEGIAAYFVWLQAGG